MAITPTAWDPANTAASITLSGGDLTATNTGYDGSSLSVFGATAGQYYWELSLSTGTTQLVGVSVPGIAVSGWPGSDPGSWTYKKSDGTIRNSTGVIQTVASGATIVGILLDSSNKKLKFQLDGVDVGTEITLTGTEFHAITGCDSATGSTVVANFGASAFTYSVPVGYSSGFGDNTARTVEVSGTFVTKAGSPTVIRGPNRTIQVDGTFATKTGTPTLLIASPQTIFANGVLATKVGGPTLVHGPNVVVQPVGVMVTNAGTPNLQLGYPATIAVGGHFATLTGTPTLLPYADKFIRPAGHFATHSGTPIVTNAPVTISSSLIQVEGSLATKTGTPTLTGSATISASGVLLTKAGTPAVMVTVKTSGVLVTKTGTPSTMATVKAKGVMVTKTGAHSLGAIAYVPGTLLAKTGTPKFIGSATIQVDGHFATLTGTPRISNMTIRPIGKLHVRTGAPKAIRSARC